MATSSSNAGAIAENQSGFPNCGGHITGMSRGVNADSRQTRVIPESWSLPVLEGWLALRDEGGHALLLILCGEQAMEQAAFEA